MICPRCGTINADDGERCKRCRGSLAPPLRPALAADRDAPADQVPTTGPAEAEPTVEIAAEHADLSIAELGHTDPGASDAPPPPPWAPPPPPPGWSPPGPAPEGWGTRGGWSPPQGPVVQDQAAREGGKGPLPTYLPQAILCAIVFNVLAGVVAIVYSVQVSKKLAAGDWNGAARSSRLARTWCWVSVVVGVVFVTLILSGSIRNPSS